MFCVAAVFGFSCLSCFHLLSALRFSISYYFSFTSDHDELIICKVQHNLGKILLMFARANAEYSCTAPRHVVIRAV